MFSCILGAQEILPEENQLLENNKHILIVKNLFCLYLMDGLDTLQVFPVALGKKTGDKEKEWDYRTPEGDFHINRIVDSSTWEHDFGGDGRGSIKGAYGPWFLSLYTGSEVTKTGKAWTGIGIHGTHDPASIGTHASEGCIRLRNEDIITLKEHVYIGMPVSVVP